jgi:hypothetical protein
VAVPRIGFVLSDCITCRGGDELVAAAPETDLFTFHYCLVENAVAVRASKFARLVAVFEAAQRGAAFCFMDASFHLWRELGEVMASVEGCEFVLLHPHPQPWQCTNTMLAVKL